MDGLLTGALLNELSTVAADQGIPRLAAVSLSHPGFQAAGDNLEEFVKRGWQGEMGYLSRTCEVRKDPTKMLPGAQSLIVTAVPYRGESGSIARYAQSTDYHFVIHQRLEPVVQRLRELLPDVDALVCVDTKPIMERAAAALAGLGFIGKHGCVIVPGLGSYVLLGSILCTATLSTESTGVPPQAIRSKVLWDACGKCRRCLDACPTDAFEGPGVLDATKCISYLTIEHRGPIPSRLADQLGERIAGCDVCQEVCPYNESAHRRSARLDSAWLDDPPEGAMTAEVEELANIGSSRYRAFVKNTALRRIPRRAMRRNALLAIGNREGSLSSAEESAIASAENDPEETVREVAVRARVRRGSVVREA